MEVKTLDGDMERKILHKDLLRERESDEDGGVKTRVEFDSDFSDEEEEENVDWEKVAMEKAAAQGTGENWSSVLSTHRKKNNCGPKGVKADYEEAKAITRRRNETKKLMDEEAFKRAVYGATTSEASVSFASRHPNGFLKTYDADAEDQGESEEEDDDQEFLAAYRSQRMAQVRGFNQLPQYGRVLYVDKFAFVDETDNADPRTYVITHIYEEYIEACRRMNKVLDQFAAKHPYVKILKMEATDAVQTLSHRALPAFLVYQNKELVNDSAIGVNEHTFGNNNFDLSNVEWFFTTRYGIELMGVNVSDQERGREASGALDAEKGIDTTSWQSSTKTSLGQVNLLGSRLANAKLDDGDDDDW